MVLSVATEKIPSDTTGNRSRDLPTSSVVVLKIGGKYFLLYISRMFIISLFCRRGVFIIYLWYGVEVTIRQLSRILRHHVGLIFYRN